VTMTDDRLRFEGVLADVRVKPDKNKGRVLILQVSTDVRKSIVSRLALMVNSQVTVEFNPQQYEISVDTGPDGRDVLSPSWGDEGRQLPLQEQPICLCGHRKEEHNLGDGGCTGASGTCICSAYQSRIGAEAAGSASADTDEGEKPEPVDKAPALWAQEDDGLWHVARVAREFDDGTAFYLCGRAITNGPGADAASATAPLEHCCPTCLVRLAEPEARQEGEQAPVPAEPAAEVPETMPDPETPCANCRHPRHRHDPAMACMVRVGDGDFCGCPGFAEPETYPVPGDQDALVSAPGPKAEPSGEHTYRCAFCGASWGVGDVCPRCGTRWRTDSEKESLRQVQTGEIPEAGPSFEELDDSRMLTTAAKPRRGKKTKGANGKEAVA